MSRPSGGDGGRGLADRVLARGAGPADDRAAGVPTLLVDAHPVVRAGLRALLERHAGLRIVGEADGVAQARAWLRTVSGSGADAVRPVAGDAPTHAVSPHPELVIVDANLHDGAATELIPDVRRLAPGATILILSRVHEPDVVRSAMRAGAHGWLDKQQDPSALADAVRAALRGELPTAAEAGRMLSAPPRSDPFQQLTPRQRQVLNGIANGLSNREIAQRLGVREKSVKAHASRIYARLGVQRRTQAALLAREHGAAQLDGHEADGAGENDRSENDRGETDHRKVRPGEGASDT